MRHADWIALSIRALLSVDEGTAIKQMAQVSALHYDALLRATTIALDPDFEDLYFPTKDHLFRWFREVGNRRIKPPTRNVPGRDRLGNVVRNVFFYNTVADLRSCGLNKTVNEGTDDGMDNAKAKPSACSVVAEVCGLKPSTVRMAIDEIEKFRS